MLTIRFSRVGRKNRAQFRIVLQEKTATPSGRHVAILGSYDPHLKVAVLKADKIKEWLGKGAQASDSVYNLFVREGIVEGDKRKVKMPKPEVKEVPVEEVKPEEVKSEEKPAEEPKTEEKPTESKVDEKPVEDRKEEVK